MAQRPGVYVTESVLTTPIVGEPAAAAAGALVAPLPSGPSTPQLVTSWYQFSELFGGLNTYFDATFSANMFFRTGGRELYVARVVKSDAVAATATLKTTDSTTWMTFTAKGKGAYGNDLRVVVTQNVTGLYDISVIKDAGVADTITSGAVTAGADDDIVLETFTNLNLGVHLDQTVINIFTVRSQYISATWNVAAAGKSITTSLTTIPLTGGSDGTSGTLDYTSALTALEAVDRTLALFMPNVVDNATVSAAIAKAEANKWFVILDTNPSITPAQAVTYAGTVTSSTYAAVYYPHLWVADPTNASRDAIRLVPPSGAVAGTYLATDASYGVFKSPAGIETAITGVVAVERSLTSTELDSLNSDLTPVNAIRVVAGVGPAIMGARTLKQTTAARYVNIRRSLTYLDREMRNRLEFAVYRNNDTLLWNQMKTVLDSFLVGFWNAGGLRGGTKAQAYYIKIDSENNSASDVANGIVNVEVGVALQYPAEFIKVKLTQQTLS